jgi:hypothetical protein
MCSLVVFAVFVACGGDKEAAPKLDPWSGAPTPAKSADPVDPWGAKPSGEAPSPPPSTTLAPGDPGSPVGLWYGMAFETGHYSMRTDRYELDTRSKIALALILPDGTMIDGAPYAGLADFDYASWARDVQRDASLGGVAGTYTWSGSSGEVTLSTGFKKPMALVDGELVLGKTTLRRVPRVDGVRLDGTYTHFTDTADPYLDGPGCKQMIALRPDGTFEDRGAFVYACPPASSEPNPPGSGTYAIRDYSLILSYADGRTTMYRITPILNHELGRDSPRFFLANRMMNRR